MKFRIMIILGLIYKVLPRGSCERTSVNLTKHGCFCTIDFLYSCVKILKTVLYRFLVLIFPCLWELNTFLCILYLNNGFVCCHVHNKAQYLTLYLTYSYVLTKPSNKLKKKKLTSILLLSPSTAFVLFRLIKNILF
jgi:hypothetical protein